MQDPRNVTRLTMPPAIAMLVLSGMQLLFLVAGFFMDQGEVWLELEETMKEADPNFELPEGLMQGAGLISNLVSMAIVALVIAAAISMLRLKSWALALAGAIAMVVPCLGPCCPIGIPFGVWAIVILSRADVRQAMGSLPPEAPDAFRVPPPPSPGSNPGSNPGASPQDPGAGPSDPSRRDDAEGPGGWGSES